jgi:NAD(P)-dependent dehydrogenase (short-subunit alcohol dehydrogenase family)
MSNILVTGGGNGLGAAFVAVLRRHGHCVVNFDHEDGNDVRVSDYADIAGLLRDEQGTIEGDPKLDILINCAGVNIINWLENFTEENWDKVMDVNAKGIYMMTRACLPMLIESKGTVVNVVSNAAHMPMTCSLAYNASKGAAHIMTLQLARELTRKHGITVFGIAPNKLHGTGMSDDIDRQVVETRGWTKEYAQEYQLKGLLSGEETPPEAVAEFLAFLLQDKVHHKYLTGTVIPYGI